MAQHVEPPLVQLRVVPKIAGRIDPPHATKRAVSENTVDASQFSRWRGRLEAWATRSYDERAINLPSACKNIFSSGRQRELAPDIESLAPLEAFLLKRFAKPDDALTLEQRAVTDAAARHLGLVLVFNVHDAKWTIDLAEEKNLYYRLPVIELADGWVTCPLSGVTASLDRRTGSYLTELAQGMREEYNGAKGATERRRKSRRPKPKRERDVDQRRGEIGSSESRGDGEAPAPARPRACARARGDRAVTRGSSMHVLEVPDIAALAEALK